MRLIYFLSFVLISCNSNKDVSETYIYTTSHDELLSLEIKDTTFQLNWIVVGAKETDKTNYYGLIQYVGKNETGQLQITRMIKNSMKTSDGKTIKAPNDGWSLFSFINETKQITFYLDTLCVDSSYSIERTNNIIKNHNNWNGEMLQLDDFRKQ